MIAPPSLAVIVIARNEEKTIATCLDSCVASVRRATDVGIIGPWEIVLIDSASTDRTVENALDFPVRVVRIPPEWPLSPAAGRFVGLRETHSDTVLFVDGDYVLEPSWLPIGLRELSDPTVAGVCGVDREALRRSSGISRYVLEHTERGVPTGERQETEAIAVGLIRRAWIDRAGGVQPFLKGAEDRDLGLRIRILGGRMVRTKAVMGTHHWAPGGELDFVEYLRSVFRWSFGEGQAARNGGDDPRIRRTYVRRYATARHAIQLEVGLLLGAWLTSSLATVLLGNLALILGAFFVGLLSVVVLGVRHPRDFWQALFGLHQVPYVGIRLSAFALGWLHRPLSPSLYPGRGPRHAVR